MNRLLHRAISIVKHDSSITLVESSITEGASDALEDDGGGGSDVVDEGDFFKARSVDDRKKKAARCVNSGTEEREVEVVGLAEEQELPAALGGENGGGAAPEASIIDAGHQRVVVGEFGHDLGRGNQR